MCLVPGMGRARTVCRWMAARFSCGIVGAQSCSRSIITTLPPRGFLTWDQNQLGFELFAGGETIFLWNSNQTRVIDVIDFRGSSNNVSQGRWPDGGPNIYAMSANSRGLPNNPPKRFAVV